MVVYAPVGVVICGVAAKRRIRASSSTTLTGELAELAMVVAVVELFQAKPAVTPYVPLEPCVYAPPT